jgi:hypothetical protein
MAHARGVLVNDPDAIVILKIVGFEPPRTRGPDGKTFPTPRNEPVDSILYSYTRLTNKSIGAKLVVGVRPRKRHRSRTLYCSVLR